MGFYGARGAYVSSVAYAAVTTWSALATVAAGDIRSPTAPAVGAELVYICLTGGTTDATEPTWTNSRGAKITESGGVVWQECTGIAALCGDLSNTPDWSFQTSLNASLGHVITDTAGTHIFICSTSGNCGATEPTWNTAAVGNTTTDNAATWTYLGTGFSAWQAAHKRLWKAMQTGWGDISSIPGIEPTSGAYPGGMFYYCADNHVEDMTGATNSPPGRGTADVPCRTISIDHTAAMPPSNSTMKKGATIGSTTTGIWAGGNGGCGYAFGMIYNPTSGNNGVTLNPAPQLWEQCTFAPNGNGGISTGGVSSEFIDCVFKPGGTGWTNYCRGNMRYRGCSIDNSTATPTVFLNTNNDCSIVMEACDLSNLGAHLMYNGGTSAMQDVTLRNCKIPATFDLQNLSSTQRPGYGCHYRMIDCDDGTGVLRSEMRTWVGDMTTVSDVYRSTGAVIEGNNFSWQVDMPAGTTSGRACILEPFDIFQLGAYNTTTGADITATIYGMFASTAQANNEDIWAEVTYQGDSSTPLATVKTDKLSGWIPYSTLTDHSADTSNWTGTVAARQDSHSYAVGDRFVPSTNSSRVFVCTGAGISAAGEPGGYSTMVDGDSITDGAATMVACQRFKMQVTLTSPQAQHNGVVYAKVRMGVPSGKLWIDPVLNLA